jgi:hypothetical protein
MAAAERLGEHAELDGRGRRERRVRIPAGPRSRAEVVHPERRPAAIGRAELSQLIGEARVLLPLASSDRRHRETGRVALAAPGSRPMVVSLRGEHVCVRACGTGAVARTKRAFLPVARGVVPGLERCRVRSSGEERECGKRDQPHRPRLTPRSSRSPRGRGSPAPPQDLRASSCRRACAPQRRPAEDGA